MRAVSRCLVGLSFAIALPLSAQTIRTIGGGGIDDGILATKASLSVLPDGLTFDDAGNLYFSDTWRHRVRYIDKNGIIRTFAGNGILGFTGDGSPADEAALARPNSIIYQGGRFYLADRFNQRIRVIDGKTRIISTVIGGGRSTAEYVPADQAYVGMDINDVAVSRSGAVYYSDGELHRVRMFDPKTGLVHTVAGDGSTGQSADGPATTVPLTRPEGLALAPDDSALFIADYEGFRFRKLDLASGTLTTIAGTGQPGEAGEGGPAAQAQVDRPFRVAFDRNGDLYLMEWALLRQDDYRLGRVQRIHNGVITTVIKGTWGPLGDGQPAFDACMQYSNAMAFDAANNLYIVDSFNQRVRRVDAKTSIITTVAGGNDERGDGGPATSAILDNPRGVAIDDNRNIYVTDAGWFTIRRIDPNGIITTAAETIYPETVAVDDRYLYFVDGYEHAVIKRQKLSDPSSVEIIAGGGTGNGESGAATDAGFGYAGGIAVDRAGGYLYMVANSSIYRVTISSLQIKRVAGTRDHAGHSGDGGPATSALATPAVPAVDSHGNLYFSDSPSESGGYIRRVDAQSGVISTVAGGGSSLAENVPATQAFLEYPSYLTFDSADRLLISEAWRIRRLERDGTIVTVAGSVEKGGNFDGDGGAALAAGMGPAGLAVDPGSGALVFADWDGNRVRQVDPCRPPAVPIPVSPAEASAIEGVVTLVWKVSEPGSTFDIYLDSAPIPSQLVATGVTSTNFTISNLPPLAGGGRYYWRVVSNANPYCAGYSSVSSAVASFAVKPACAAPAAFNLISPASGATVAGQPTLAWQAAAGAGSYDVFLGASNPPAHLATTSSTSLPVTTPLTPGTTYYWSVTAVAACESQKVTSSATGIFATAGACAGPRPFATTAPADGSAVAAASVTLSWTASDNAASYDLYFGADPNPPLVLAGLHTREALVSALQSQQSYYWRVVAQGGCATAAPVSTSVARFTSAVCPAAAATEFTFLPSAAAAGETYVVAWKPSSTAAASYTIERSTDRTFATVLDRQTTAETHASFTAPASGAYYHRVLVTACDGTSVASAAATVAVTDARPNVIFTTIPRGVMTKVGDELAAYATSFTVENISEKPVSLSVLSSFLEGVPFFGIVDPLSGPVSSFVLEPHSPKKFLVRFSGPDPKAAAAYTGIVAVLQSNFQPLAVPPFAFVSLRISESSATTSAAREAGVAASAAAPVFGFNGGTSEYAFFPGLAGDDARRDPITVTITNPRGTPLDLTAEVGPEAWLVPEAGWNATSIAPGATRPVRLRSRRALAPSGSALPRFTYFTVRTQDGATARLLVQDNDAPPVTAGRTSRLPSGSHSFIVPAVTTSPSLYSQVRISNIGNDEVQTEVLFTPNDGDGFDSASVKGASVLVPPNDVVTLIDPLRQLFGISGTADGQIEIRAAADHRGMLLVTAARVAPAAGGGRAVDAVPVVASGEGARAGAGQSIAGVSFGGQISGSLLLVETGGADSARVRVALRDVSGAVKGESTMTVPRYGQRRIDISTLGASSLADGCIDLSIESGGGSVVGALLMSDRARGTGDVVLSHARRVADTVAAATGRSPSAAGAPSVSIVAPLVVGGPIAGLPAMNFRTRMGLTLSGGSAASAVATFRPADGSAPVTRTIPLAPNVVTVFENVLQEMFGLSSAQSRGALMVSAPPGFEMYLRLLQTPASGASSWQMSGALPLVPSSSEILTSAKSRRPVYLDGLEQSVDAGRGRHCGVIVTNTAANSGTFWIRLYEAGNRAVPIAQRLFTIAPYGQTSVDDVFAALDLSTPERNKDRSNVLCAVEPASGDAVVSAVGVQIDNRTGNTSTFAFSPTGGVASTGSFSIPMVTAKDPTTEAPGRRRAVGH